MIARSQLVVSCLAALLATGCHAAKTPKPPKAAKPAKAGKAPPVDPTCKEPAPKDPDLAAALAEYGLGHWPEAAKMLGAWAAKADAEKDPAAARGLYSLGYASRAAGDTATGDAAMNRAEPLLKARMASSPTLESAYYLQGLYQVRSDSASQLATISAALRDVEAGKLCANPDADDMFREARMYELAGVKDKQRALLEKASAAYAASPGIANYRANTEKMLGDALLEAGDVAGAAEHLGQAAKLNPALPGVHRSYGTALLRIGRFADAAAWWRANWRNERDDGNGLIYAIPVIDDVVRLKPLHQADAIADLSAYTTPALELNAELEAKRYLEIADRAQEAKATGGELSGEDRKAMEVAELRMAQLLVEYVARRMDLQELALQKGLLRAIHDRELPTR